jgi:ATP-dependent protease ClpP protease subunit
MKMPLKILAKDKAEAEVYVYDYIGEYWGEGISAKAFVDEINKLDVATIHLHINSGGGDVFEGAAMYNALLRHKATVVTHIDSLAASAASILAMAGNTIEISGNAFLMIHNPWSIAVGDAADMRHEAELLDTMEATYAKTYAIRSNGKTSSEKFREMMIAETWLNAEQAVETGLADTVTEPLQMAAKLDLSRFGYKNTPKNLLVNKAQPFQIPELDARLVKIDATMKKLSTALAGRRGKTSSYRRDSI